MFYIISKNSHFGVMGFVWLLFIFFIILTRNYRQWIFMWSFQDFGSFTVHPDCCNKSFIYATQFLNSNESLESNMAIYQTIMINQKKHFEHFIKWKFSWIYVYDPIHPMDTFALKSCKAKHFCALKFSHWN